VVGKPEVMFSLTVCAAVNQRVINGIVRRLQAWGYKEARRLPMNLHAIGIELGKTVFHLVGLSQTGEVVVRKKFSRTQLLRFTSELAVIHSEPI
jgi:hypothetical protein